MSITQTILRFNTLGRKIAEHAVTMTDEEPSDCLLWALKQRALHGGAVVFVPSAYGRWEHALWRSPEGVFWEFDPFEAKYRRTDVPTLYAGAPKRVMDL